jgi:hypothetical protein
MHLPSVGSGCHQVIDRKNGATESDRALSKLPLKQQEYAESAGKRHHHQNGKSFCEHLPPFLPEKKAPPTIG